MTTAHRPTFHGAIATDTPGGNRMLGSGTQHLCARNLPGELKLKFRSDLEGKSILEPEDGKKAEKPLEALQSARDADVLLESSDDEGMLWKRDVWRLLFSSSSSSSLFVVILVFIMLLCLHHI